MLSAPGIIYLVPEGYRDPNHSLLLISGVLIDVSLYASVIYVILLLWRVATRQRRRA